jgi:hypothetical protein
VDRPSRIARRDGYQRRHPRGTIGRAAPGPQERGAKGYDEHAERARRLDVLQRTENEFDPIPFGAEAARAYGMVTAAVVAAGRKPGAESPIS